MNVKIEELTETVTTIRRELHQIPEIGFNLPKTSAYVKKKLLEYGYEPCSVAQTGWIAVLEGKTTEAIAFRSDMDALEVAEETGMSFASQHAGRMHACGHDGHMALLLGFAKYLKSLPELKKTVVLIFQPAEEGPGGAKVIMESGILQKLNVNKIYGYHVYPDLPEGKIGLATGPLMARNGEFNITLEGKSAHAGQPHLGNDAIVAAAHVVLAVQNIVSRNLDPLEPAVVNIGTLQAGEVRNIVAGKAKLSGTIRSYDTATYLKIKERLAAICDGIKSITAVNCVLDITDFYPAVINDEKMIQLIMDSLDKEAFQVIKPVMLAEDFSFYQEGIRGVFMFLGTSRPDKGWTSPLHSGRFNFDEKVLLKGIELYARILKIENIL